VRVRFTWCAARSEVGQAIHGELRARREPHHHAPQDAAPRIVTTKEGQSVAKDPLLGEIKICQHRIAVLNQVGWPAAVESWQETLDGLEKKLEQRNGKDRRAGDRRNERVADPRPRDPR